MNIGLKVCSLLFALSAISCTPQTTSSSIISSSNYDDIIDKQSVSLTECLSQEEEHYLVYFYSPTCTPCSEIKGDVVSFAVDNVVKTYFLNTKESGNEIQKCSADEVVVGVDDVADLYIVGTPTLVEVKNGTTTSNVAGKNKCLNLLNQLRTDNNQSSN